MNKAIIVGKIEEIAIWNDQTEITVAVSRGYENADGVYETDLIPCRLLKEIANSVNEYCNVGDVVGINGNLVRLLSGELVVNVEKISFLSSKRKEN